MAMTRKGKIEYMLNDLAQKGVGKYTAAPPVYRALWRLGFDVAPPPFAAFWSNALLMGGFFAVAWGVFMWLAVWQGPLSARIILMPAVAGTSFGIAMATYHRWRWRKLRLPRWEDYPALSDGARVSG